MSFCQPSVVAYQDVSSPCIVRDSRPDCCLSSQLSRQLVLESACMETMRNTVLR